MQLMETQMKLLAESDVLERALQAVLADPKELSWDDDYIREDNYDRLLAGTEV